MNNNLPANIPTYVVEKISQAIAPVAYTEAVRALAACRSIDESKHWSDKADALAAWAKIFKNDEAAAEAKRLKAHAYRRMSQLADELRPVAKKAVGGRKGFDPGPAAELMKAGLTARQTVIARRVGAIKPDRFNELINSPNPPGMVALSREGIGKSNSSKSYVTRSESWRLFAGEHGGYINAAGFRGFCRRNSAYALGRAMNTGEVTTARALVKELREWLDEFEDALPKE